MFEGEHDDDGSSALAALTVGTVIDGRYRVDEILGEGAMGVVVGAKHLSLGERVALKFLRCRSRGVDDDFRARFRREARVSAMLRDEHVTRVTDVGIWRDHVPYMVMEYLAGTDLRRLVKSEGPLPVARAVDLVVQICVGMAEAHGKGVVHRDLKPSNVFVVPRADGSELVKIIDFGISKWAAGEADLDELTKTGIVLGSPKYMAPEQLAGSARVDARADVWSIGAILYQLLAGRPPFDFANYARLFAEVTSGRPPPAFGAEVPKAVEAVLMRCFASDPDARVQNVAQLAGGLLDALEAPFAAAVRERLEATLRSGAELSVSVDPDARSPSSPVETQGSDFPTMAERSSASVTANAQALDVPTPASPRRSLLIAAALAAVAVVAVIAEIALTRRSEPAPIVPAALDTAAAGPTPPVVPGPQTPPTASAGIAEPIATPVSASGAGVTSHRNAMRPATVPPSRNGAPSASAVSPTLGATAAAPAPPAAAGAKPPPTTKSPNPLDDRQ